VEGGGGGYSPPSPPPPLIHTPTPTLTLLLPPTLHEPIIRTFAYWALFFSLCTQNWAVWAI